MAEAEPSTIATLVRGIRAGDERCAAELVRRYEPLIQREIRLRLEDRRLGRLYDPADICQSVLASFFVRTAAGQYDLDRPEQLTALLATMARNKLAAAARRQGRQRRDRRREAADGPAALEAVAAADPSPSRLVAGRELWERFHRGLSAEERTLAALREQGLTWAEVADRLGGTAQARRVQLSRAAERVAQALGLGDEDAPDG